MSTDVGRDPTVEQHQVNVLMEVSSPTVRLLKEELGRGPMGAPTQLAETDAFLGILDGALTSAARTRREPRPAVSQRSGAGACAPVGRSRPHAASSAYTEPDSCRSDTR
jgi:hypothetical protein